MKNILNFGPQKTTNHFISKDIFLSVSFLFSFLILLPPAAFCLSIFDF